MGEIRDAAGLREAVARSLREVPVTDIHTHLYHPAFGSLLLRGIDDLLTYHYLVAETMRRSGIAYDSFFALPADQQADLVWQKLFVQSSPVSEACRGVLTTLQALGLDVRARDLTGYRAWFGSQQAEEYVDRVLRLANLQAVVMTNDPFDPEEVPVWMGGFRGDGRFFAALRIDPLVNGWERAHGALRERGYAVDGTLSAGDQREVIRFLSDWADRMDPLYLAVSMPNSFAMPEESSRATVIERCILPFCRERGLPFALMIGVKRQVNPGLRLAGDSVGRSRIAAVEYLCRAYPDNRFLVTMLARENQHELAVTARKFRNLLPFGCWWFMNNPSLVAEVTRMRLELLGTGFIPQHSDARVLDQVIYKWEHARRVIGDVLTEQYADLMRTGWMLTEEEVRRDAADLLGGNFWRFIGRRPPA
jgi:hypothetical protein